MDKLPPKGGMTLSLEEYEQLLEKPAEIGWLAFHAEDFLAMGGESHHRLEKLSEHYPLSLRAEGLSIGSAESVNEKHLQNIKGLCERYQPCNVTTSLSWARWQGTYLGSSMPLPLTLEALDQATFNLRAVQNSLGRRVSVINNASYIQFNGEQLPQGSFLEELVRQTGCGLVLDITQLYCSAMNTRQDPFKLLQTIPLAAVKEIYLCGQAMIRLGDDEVLSVADPTVSITKPVWQLYREALNLLPQPLATLVKTNPNDDNLQAVLPELQKVNTEIHATDKR